MKKLVFSSVISPSEPWASSVFAKLFRFCATVWEMVGGGASALNYVSHGNRGPEKISARNIAE